MSVYILILMIGKLSVRFETIKNCSIVVTKILKERKLSSFFVNLSENTMEKDGALEFLLLIELLYTFHPTLSGAFLFQHCCDLWLNLAPEVHAT